MLAVFTGEQKSSFEQAAKKACESVFEMMKNGVTASDLSSVLLAESIVSKCAPTDEEQAAAVLAAAQEVTGVEIYEDDVATNYPVEYTYRLYGEDGIQMNVKCKVSTSLGDARKKAVITLRAVEGSWKNRERVKKSL